MYPEEPYVTSILVLCIILAAGILGAIVTFVISHMG